MSRSVDLSRYLLQPGAAVAGHAVELLFAEHAYPAMLEAIAGARREVLLESYIFADDGAGRRFCAALLDRARAGVSVLVLVDGFGSLSLDERWKERLRDGGVALAVFHPVRPWRPRWEWSVRDHRKLLVVDGAVAFVGGMNVSDDYAPRAWGGRAWHDAQARVAGPAVSSLRRQFAAAWTRASGARPWTEGAEGTPAAAPPPAGGDGALVQPLGVGGPRERRRIRKHYQFLVRRAERTVRMMFGYFIPDRGWIRLLRNAARRGVDVRVMFPGQTDVPAMMWAARATYGRLLASGVRVFEWQASTLHAKVLSVDRAACAIGSYNLDRRSLLLNWELSVLVAGGEAAAAFEERFELDETTSREVTWEEWEARGPVARIAERFSYALRPWL